MIGELPVPKAIIFDWDNTLVDTWPIIHEALNSTFESVGLPLWTFEQTRARVRKSMRDSFPEIFGENWQEAGAIYQGNYKARHLEQLTALPLAVELLEQIKAMGLYNVVVSNKKGDTLRKESTKLGWDGYFNALVGSQDAAHDKPHKDPVDLALKDIPITAGADVWFIGDSDIDLECAKNTGCTAILYGAEAAEHTEYTASHFIGAPYHAHVHNHEQLIALLQNKEQAATA